MGRKKASTAPADITTESKGKAETPLMAQYNRIKAQYPDAILLFRMGDFYETFGADAVVAAGILGITLTKRGNGSAQNEDLAGFPHHALDNYLPKLVKAGRRVAICDQLEDPKTTKKLVKRGVTEVVTPGVVMGDNVLSTKENNYVAAVYVSAERAGLSLLDISTGEYLCSEGSMEHIEKLLESYQPKELLVEHRFRHEVERSLGYRGYVYELEDWCFVYERSKNRLLSHFGVQSLKGFGIDHLSLAICASGAILNYLEMTSHSRLGHITALRCIDRSGYMRLDAFTLRNLEIIQPLNAQEGKSLLDILDETRTPMGGRLMRQWLAFPLIDKVTIEERLSLTTELYKRLELRETISHRLSMIGDLERLSTKAVVGRIGPREVNQLRHSLVALGEIARHLEDAGSSLLSNFAHALDGLEELCDLIDQTIVPDAPLALGRGPVIARGVDAELDDLRHLSGSGKEFLVALQQRESERTGIPSLKVAFNNVFGYYIEVRHTHRDRVPAEWIRKQTLVSAERYITAELKEYEEKILGAEERIAIIEMRIFTELVERLGGYIQTIQTNSRLIAQLDCLTSLAEVAQRYGYHCPTITSDTSLRIVAGRHPVIERMLPLGQSYVPNDVELDTDRQQIMIITGPNMSGKSALLRQTALITLMAQIGSYIPAESASIGIVDSIFTRVGASDNISRGESTFMVEMQEAASILNNLTPRSLILFDELGRGTSTYDGISIAWSIVEYLHDNRVGRPKTLFATHYHELNDLEGQLERVRNFNVSAKEIDGKMLFLRKLVSGGSEHSFGIQVAKLGGMPQCIVERASKILRELEDGHASSIAQEVAEHIGAKAISPKQDESKAIEGVQMSFFQLDDPVLSQIRDKLLKVDINHLTPLEALNKLSEIQSLLKMP